MDIVGGFKKGLDAAINPDKKSSMGIGDALTFYYKAAIIPLILAIVLGSIGAYLIKPSLVLLIIPLALVYILILIPIGLLIDAAIYQFFDKILFKVFKGDISKTFTAMMYSVMPSLIFSFILLPILLLGISVLSTQFANISALGLTPSLTTSSSSVPVTSPFSELLASGALIVFIVLIEFASFIICTWGSVVLVVSLSKLQKISIGRAIGALILPVVVISIILLIIIFALSAV